MPSAIIDAAKLDWHSNTKGKWTAFVDDLDAGTPVFDKGYTFTVSGSSITVESDRRPSGVLEYPSTDTNIAPVKELMGSGCSYGFVQINGTPNGSISYNDTLDLAKGKSVKQIYKNVMRGSNIRQWNGNPSSQFGRTVAGSLNTGAATPSTMVTGVSNRFRSWAHANWGNGATANDGLAGFSSYSNAALRFSAQMLGVDDLRVYTVDQVLAMCKQYAEDQYEAGDPITLYISYRLSSKVTKSDVAPLPLALATGYNAVVAEDSTTTTNYFEAVYDAYEWDEVTYQGCVYLHRHNGVDTRFSGAMNTKKTEHVAAGDMLVNLTLWFGNTTGAVPSNAVFYTLFPQWKHQIPPYDEGTLLNYKGTGIRTIGFNAYNPATGTAVLLGGNQYQVCGTYTSVSYVDQWGGTEELTLDAHGIFTPLNDGVLAVEGGNSTDTCVHLCWSGYKNYGEPEYKWEPYTELDQTWDLSPFFPDGLNGRAGVYDEMTADERTVRWHKHVFDGTESLTVYGTNTLYWANAEIASAEEFAACNLLAPTHVTSSPTEQYRASLSVSSGRVDLQGIYFLAGAEHSLNPVGDVKSWLKKLYNAGNPLFVVYPIKTPEVSAVSNAPNFTYNVNDFGTEQSLPVNTVELLSADMNVQIRYSEDFTRLLVHYSDMYPELSALAKEEKAGQIMRIDDTAQNAYNLIDRNAAGTERQFSFDTSGGAQDITDGTAIAKKVMGTTLNLNQLVHDTNENTVESVDGNATVSDAVAGQVKHLVVSGDTVVVNQLVHEHVEKTESGTGRIWIKDAFEKEAKGLKVTAPRSVVVNQLVQNGNFETNNWGSTNIASSSVTDNVMSFTVNAQLGYRSKNLPKLYNGHVYLFTVEMKAPYANIGIQILVNLSTQARFWYSNAQAQTGTFGRVSGKWTSTMTASNGVFKLCDNNSSDWQEIQCRNAMAVDLTQYFNGNQTLIDSITSWDDLVAYDSAFANYVQYNTGTVKGVTPALTLNGAAQPFATAPQEMFGVVNYYYTQPGVGGLISDTYDVLAGSITRKVGYVDLSTLTWTYNSEASWHVASVPSGMKMPTNVNYCNFMCSNYMAIPRHDNLAVGTCFTQYSTLYVNTGSSTVTPTGMLYYELATPVVTDVTPVTFDLVSHDNTIFQTSGDLKAGIEATYDGLNQTIALDPAHTYAFNHQYVEDSIITGESSIDCVGTEDNLVDLTQLYAGDATRIAAIHSWASLSSRIHMYRDWLPYNPGEIVNLSATIRVYQHEHAYGVVYDPSQSSPACQKVELVDGVITEVEEFSALPAHNFRRCVMDDLATRHVNYYLDPLDSTKKADGTSSVLTGADGDVMVEIPITHWYIDEDYNGEGKVLWLVSDQPFTGSEIHPYFYVGPGGDTARTQYVGAYRACLCDAEGNPLNTTEGALARNDGSASTNTLRSFAGALPAIYISVASLRTWASRTGGMSTNELYRGFLYIMMIIEYGTLDSQQISPGYSGGSSYFWAWRKSGRVNYGNGTGQLEAVDGTQDMDAFLRMQLRTESGWLSTYNRDVLRDADGRYAWSAYYRGDDTQRYFTGSPVPSAEDTVYMASTGDVQAGVVNAITVSTNQVIQFQYRGIENPFGECWELCDGIQTYTKLVRLGIRVNNLMHNVDHAKDGPGTNTAWTTEDGTSTVWTQVTAPDNGNKTYSNPECTVETGYTITALTLANLDGELWRTSDTTMYSSDSQRAAQDRKYGMQRVAIDRGSTVKTFDPVTMWPRLGLLTNSTTTYTCDLMVNASSSGTMGVYFGGSSQGGNGNGMECVNRAYSMNITNVAIAGRISC